MSRRRLPVVLLGLTAALGVSACSDDDRDAVSDALNTIVDEAEEAGRTAISEVGDAAQDVTNDAAEAAVRNLATQQGEEQFADAGHPLDGDGLTCEASVDTDASNVSVSCTGTTEDGGIAELTGATDELPGVSITELGGSFTGTVDGAEVFDVDALGG